MGINDQALIDLWLQRPKEQRTDNHVLEFYIDLEKNKPELLPMVKGSKDQYQVLYALLSRHFYNPPVC
jgi:hypothetical protein